MQVLLRPVCELAEYDKMKSLLEKDRKPIGLFGCVDSQKVHIASALGENFKVKLVVTYSEMRAREIYEDFLLYEPNCVIYGAKDLMFYQADIHSNDITKQRMMCYRKLIEGDSLVVITTFSALMNVEVPLEVISKNCIDIGTRGMLNLDRVSKQLVKMGYERSHQVEEIGQFSIRGSIIDIFDLTEENPYRIELWGDEVESIRTFDVLSQRSIEIKKNVKIFPANEMIMSESEIYEGLRKIEKETKIRCEELRKQFLTEEAYRLKSAVENLREEIVEFQSYVNLESYVKYFYSNLVSFVEMFDVDNTLIVLDEQSKLKSQAEAIELEFNENMSQRLMKGYILSKQADILYGRKKVANIILKYSCMSVGLFETRDVVVKLEDKFDIVAKSLPAYQNNFKQLCDDITKYKKEKYRILIMFRSRTRAKRIANELMDNDIIAFYSEDRDREIKEREIMTTYGVVGKSFEYPLLKFVVISESDIFNEQPRKRKEKSSYKGERIKDYAQLSVGDYIVHENHGLGIYRGIEKIESGKAIKDYVKIEYAKGDNLYIVATELDVLQKYASAGARKPKLNKLGGKEWATTKSKVRGNLVAVAKELVELYAKRQEKKGYRYSEDSLWQNEFEELFPYRETYDQVRAIEDTKRDMESERIMDRLICGDVGYGKTEIALRAAFKAVTDGKQVAYLVPTTILAQQHYNTFSQRMKNFPIRVELLSRFRSAKQQKDVIKALKRGEVDIIIGTHRLLSKDVEFRDLGLLIVDEEQRFGVTHKEKIKQIKDEVDVITLTATPIPRTLHMSLIGIRDMSILEEAPNERLPIQTYVMEYNDELVREAIVRELSRGGQVYYVYNRVEHIQEVASELIDTIPEANITYAHGQMKENELERIMYAFANGEIDVLVATTIIETGLDISNANTIIIHDSDKFGLAQLYQLRGRVGRSNRNAYAFLLYQKDKLLKEVAEKRLQAIKEFTRLGSGFKIAMRDLEIRGAGNLLGMKQHGHMDAVGYEMYCKMLGQEVNKLKGIATKEEITTSVDITIDAYIPNTYIVNEIQKLDIYKRIANISNEVELNEMNDELLDRFGEVPLPARNLLRIAMVKARANKLYITDVKEQDDAIKLIFTQDAKIDPEKLVYLVEKSRGQFAFRDNTKPTLVYRRNDEEKSKNVVEIVEKLLQNIEVLIII